MPFLVKYWENMLWRKQRGENCLHCPSPVSAIWRCLLPELVEGEGIKSSSRFESQCQTHDSKIESRTGTTAPATRTTSANWVFEHYIDRQPGNDLCHSFSNIQQKAKQDSCCWRIVKKKEHLGPCLKLRGTLLPWHQVITKPKDFHPQASDCRQSI